MRFFALAALAAAFGGCATSPSLESQVTAKCVASGMTDRECACVVGAMHDNLSDADFRWLAEATLADGTEAEQDGEMSMDRERMARMSAATERAEQICSAS